MTWDWVHAAVCRAEGDPEIFHPVCDRDSNTNYALSLCQVCPVRTECLETALAGGFSGIWGGTTEDARRALRRRVVAV